MVLHRLRVEKKNELFTQVGQHVCAKGHSDTAEPVIQALLEREKRQNTAQRGGVAISAPTVEGLDFAQVMIVTLEQAIDYEGSGRAKVDVVLLVLAPSSDRRAQLWLRERMARMAMRTSLLERIRDATDIEGIRNCVLEIAREEEI
jgi:mannitol/fructose-specific phosphotransferase system IIA component (Ntr-type)